MSRSPRESRYPRLLPVRQHLYSKPVADIPAAVREPEPMRFDRDENLVPDFFPGILDGGQAPHRRAA